MTDAEHEEWCRKRLESAVKYNEKFKRELILENERLSERLNELQTLFPTREIPAQKNLNEEVGEMEVDGNGNRRTDSSGE